MKSKRILAFVCALALIAALCACGAKEAKPLADIFSDIKAQVTFADNIEFNDVSKLDRYYGISADQVSEFAGCVSNSGTDQEEVILIKAADDAAAEMIQGILEEKYQAKLNENKNYNPEQAAMIEQCSVERSGLYVSMIISPNAAAITKIYQEAIGA